MRIDPFLSEDGHSVARFEVTVGADEMAQILATWTIDLIGEAADGMVLREFSLHPSGTELDAGAVPIVSITLARPAASSPLAPAAPAPPPRPTDAFAPGAGAVGSEL